MKNLAMVVALIVCLIAMVGFVSNTKEKPVVAGTETYAIVTSVVSSRGIHIYYGGQEQEEIKIEKGASYNNAIVDVLNSMNEKGYELITADAHLNGMTAGSFIELHYTFRKRK